MSGFTGYGPGSWWENAMAGGGMMPSVQQLPQMSNSYPGAMAPPMMSGFNVAPGIQNFDPMAVPGMQGGGGWFDSFLTKKDAMGNTTMGWGNTLLGLGQAGLQGYLGLQQLGLAKDNLAFQKDSFSKQFENQRTLTNAQLEDRQNARVASNPHAYASTEEYMKKHGI